MKKRGNMFGRCETGARRGILGKEGEGGDMVVSLELLEPKIGKGKI